ncbi:hypothetical protein [Candidatus Liberibacter brunswickensis]|uniref:hypothetical protein n=1 Tax=Candidatus Liberibacter brunswickensis TaxID=1968796 RepID=UPI002FE2E95E
MSIRKSHPSIILEIEDLKSTPGSDNQFPTAMRTFNGHVNKNILRLTIVSE